MTRLTEARGHIASAHHLVMFGGAGGQMGTGIAAALDIPRVILPRFSSILSAYGMSLADVVSEVQRPAALTLGPEIASHLEDQFALLEGQGAENLSKQGFDESSIYSERYLNCRYKGSSTQLMIEEPADHDFAGAFAIEHQKQFGFVLENRDILAEDIRIRATGRSTGSAVQTPHAAYTNANLRQCDTKPFSSKQVYFENSGYRSTATIPLNKLAAGEQVTGPAILFDETQTILVEPDWVATALPEHVLIDLAEKKVVKAVLDAEHVDPVHLSVMGHRFMSIAEQMGNVLRQTAISINIKERLDFSCALFAPDGGLVANAPHIPAHLGAMSFAVKWQSDYYAREGGLVEGDVIVSNHPAAGGSHLPDVTVLVPTFHKGKIVFWTAARAHHADIGGIAAGSMPPFSKELWQEGAQVKSFKLVNNGVFDEAGVIRIFSEEPARYPGCSGTRTLKDNISDLKAQVASW